MMGVRTTKWRVFQSRKNTELWLRMFESCNGCNSIHPENGIEMELSLKWVYVIGGDNQVIWLLQINT